MGDSIGAASLVGFRKAATNAPWGFPGGVPVVVGANHGIWVDQFPISPDAQYLPSLGVTGSSQKRRGVKGAELVELTLGPTDVRFRGVEVPLAMAMGSDTAVQIGATAAYLHTMKPTASQVGLWGSAAWKDANGVTELPFVGLNGFQFSCENNGIAKLSFPGFSHGMFINSGVADDDAIVVDVLPANGALTLTTDPYIPSAGPTPFLATVTDDDASISAMSTTFVYEDADGQLHTEVWTFAPGTLTYTSQYYLRKMISITLAGVVGAAGADRIKVGITAGYNTLATAANITVPAEAETGGFAVFGMLQVQILDQDSATAIGSAGLEASITNLTITANPGRVAMVTTPYGRRIAEPRANEHWTFEIGFNYDLANDARAREYLTKTHKKIKAEFIGGICDGNEPYRLTFYLNDVAFSAGAKSLGGPGKIPLDITGMASQVSAAPVGFPAGTTDGLTVELVNKLTTSAVA